MSHGTERVALTVVSDTKVLEELKWWQQGDAALETCDMIEARQGNRRKEEVLRQLETWWEAACFLEKRAAGVSTRICNCIN